MKILVLVYLILFISQEVFAFPQFVKDGYFACNSCHVSASGGDALTPYGRGFSEEMLTMMTGEGQSQPVWKKEALPENLLLAGHFRWIQIFSDNLSSRKAQNFWMQKELDLGFQSERFTSYLTAAELPPNNGDDSQTIGIRKWTAKMQLNENLSISLGSSIPKFGLMLNDHNAFVNQMIGQKPGNEKGRLEGTYLTEAFELTTSAVISELPIGTENRTEEDSQQFATYFGYFLLNKHRIALGLLQAKETQVSQGISLSGTFTLGKGLTTSTEISLFRPELGSPTKELATYFDLVFEPTKGVWIQPILETFLTRASDPRSKTEKQQVRVSIFPFSHFDLKFAIGQYKSHSDYSFGNFGSILFHYWI